jgi:RNA polymerase sigma factor (TIGR02999 family)
MAASARLFDPDRSPKDSRAVDQLFSLAYEELRRLASSVSRYEVSETLNPTALVNEAWLKLANSSPFQASSLLHFKRIAARAMRQVLIEAARKRKSQKRGSEQIFITFDESVEQASASANELLALDSALELLAQMHPRQAALVEGRFFGGFEMNELAEMLGISEATAMRDWRAARAWLANALREPR